jgi:MFS superfamily sulfate permease-like transporter
MSASASPDVPAGRPTPGLFDTWREDFPASIVVFLVALPLCLGIAVASGAPVLSGMVAGIVGGLVVGFASGSPLMVSGPAAGLTTIVIAGIAQVGGFASFLPAVMLAGVLQLTLGAARAGVIGYYFPSAVIKGMLAAIGLTLILKQIPHAVGYDADFEGDFAFVSPSGENTFTAIAEAMRQIQPGAVAIALVGVALMVLWPKTPMARIKLLPAPLLAVLLGVGINEMLELIEPAYAIRDSHLVNLPVGGIAGVADQVARPNWAAFGNPQVWILGITLGIVASLESLLSLEATNKLDPEKRDAPANRELLAQGLGNLVSGFFGGLPVTGVIVRSSANVDAGARSRLSAIIHGIWLVIAVIALGAALNRIPLAALASILLVTGYKLSTPALWRSAWQQGWSHFIPFAVTIIAILFTDLLRGIGIGLVVGIGFIIAEHMRRPAMTKVSPPGAILTRYLLPDQVTFLSKAKLASTLDAIPSGSRVEIDGRKTLRFDYDALEVLLQFRDTARSRNIDYRLVGIPETSVTPAH